MCYVLKHQIKTKHHSFNRVIGFFTLINFFDFLFSITGYKIFQGPLTSLKFLKIKGCPGLINIFLSVHKNHSIHSLFYKGPRDRKVLVPIVLSIVWDFFRFNITSKISKLLLLCQVCFYQTLQYLIRKNKKTIQKQS